MMHNTTSADLGDHEQPERYEGTSCILVPAYMCTVPFVGSSLSLNANTQ